MMNNRPWTPDEDRQIADLYGTGLIWSLTERLQRTESDIRDRAATLGIPGPDAPEHLVSLLDDVIVDLAERRSELWSSFVQRSGIEVGRVVDADALVEIDRLDTLASRCREARDALDAQRAGAEDEDGRAVA